MGITDLYPSPIFLTRRGSMHGYDIVDPNRLNPGLGTDSDFTASALDQLLSEQRFRLSFWKVAAEEINYRRFFNINEAPDKWMNILTGEELTACQTGNNRSLLMDAVFHEFPLAVLAPVQ